MGMDRSFLHCYSITYLKISDCKCKKEKPKEKKRCIDLKKMLKYIKTSTRGVTYNSFQVNFPFLLTLKSSELLVFRWNNRGILTPKMV